MMVIRPWSTIVGTCKLNRDVVCRMIPTVPPNARGPVVKGALEGNHPNDEVCQVTTIRFYNRHARVPRP